MSLGRVIEGLLALGVPQVIRDAAGNSLGLKTGSGTPLPQAVVHAFPNTPQVYCSPVAGNPDTANQYSLGGLATHIGTGFLMPKAGVLTDIGIIAQGNAGAGTPITVRWTVCSIKSDPTASTGIAVDQIIDTGLADIANNFNGNVLVASGKTLAVPSQFMVFLKAGIGQNVYAQLLGSAGPLPGVVGNVSGSVLTSAATYATSSVDLAVPPAGVVAGDPITILQLKPVSVYVKWKGQ